MRGLPVIVLIAALSASCSRPSSYEPFVVREKAEYGDTYSFILDMSDSLVSYSLDFYTRLDRQAFGEFPSDSIVLDLRWFSPSDSIIIDTTMIRIGSPVGEAYYSRDFISPYPGIGALPCPGAWRLKARIVNDSPQVRGLGVIFKRKPWDTTN